MDERAALRMLGDALDHAGDDAAVVDDQVLTTDMLHDATDFPTGTTRYTAGWRAVAASLSDVAAMGAAATAAVAVYGAPSFDEDELTDFVAGAMEVCDAVGADYVGGDLDEHEQFTVATTALGETDDPVLRSEGRSGDALCVTGELGRSAAALRYFRGAVPDAAEPDGDVDAVERANELFRFTPRIAAGRALAEHATAMMDVSDGLARSVHQLTEASDCGASVASSSLPIHGAVDAIADDAEDRLELGAFFGEDFELLCAIPQDRLDAARADCPTSLVRVGELTDGGVRMDGEALPDRGFTHGQG